MKIKNYNEYFLNESSKVKDIKNLFSRDSGFDTPKKINRSNEIVPKEFLDKIEDGITIEDLESSNLPIFKYRTQITIHGLFDELTISRIGGYKNIFQNKNKSIGIKWNAIDYDKKRTIYDALRTLGYSIRKTSNEYSATKSILYNKENFLKLKEEYEKIDDSLFIGEKDLYAGTIPMLGTFIFLEINIRAIYEENVWEFLNKSFDLNKDSYLDEKKRKKEEEEKNWQESRKRWKEEESIENEKKNEEWKNFTENLENVKNIENLPEECILITRIRNNKYLIKKYKRKGENVYQVMPYSLSEKDKINKRLRKWNKDEDKIKKLIEKGDVYLLNIIKGSKIKRFDDFKEEEPIKSDFKLIDYTDRSVAVIGDTYDIKDKLKEIGGRFNKFLKDPETGQKVPGWIFSKAKKEKIKKLLGE